jgi:hypothetical protein
MNQKNFKIILQTFFEHGILNLVLTESVTQQKKEIKKVVDIKLRVMLN